LFGPGTASRDTGVPIGCERRSRRRYA
jgi:hypothetical protein